MNRTIWIWRMIAILIIIVFTILMWNLYTRLDTLKEQRESASPAVEQAEEK